MMSVATGPTKWVVDDSGTYDPEAVCPYCEHGYGQVLGGARYTVRCRCTNATCRKTFFHAAWQE